jgi:arginase family enzyme
MSVPARLAPMVRQFMDHGWTSAEVREAIEEASADSLALSADYCEVEPDGYCEHGYPSVLVAFGMI